MTLRTSDSKKDIFYLMNKYSGVISKVEIEMLMIYLFDCERLDLYVRDFSVNDTVEGLFDSLARRRLNKEPVQYITGTAEFMGMEFIVTKDVLIPRPETEILVDEIASRFTPHALREKKKILDLCTGCGNIAVSLSKLMPQAEVVATDVSQEALKVAEENAIYHGVSDRIRFYKGDIFNALIYEYIDNNSKFDIIVCNPPYIKESDLPLLQEEVRMEPRIALNGGRDGLDFYRVIAKESRRYLKSGGRLLLEIGFGETRAAKEIFSLYNSFSLDRVIQDFAGIDRAMCFNLT